MRKILIVAKREYRATVRTKTFLITIFIMPIFMGGAIAIQSLLHGRVDIDDKKMVILDGTGRLFDDLAAAAEERNQNSIYDHTTGKQIKSRYILESAPAGAVTDKLRLALSEQVRHNEFFAFVEIGSDILSHTENSGSSMIKFFSENVAYMDARRWLQRTVNNVVSSVRLQEAGLNQEAVKRATAPVYVESLGLYSETKTGEVKKADRANQTMAFFLPFGIMMLMFMSIMITAQPMLYTVIEEKQLRIAEVLLGSASPFQLMMGKLVGNVGVSLTIVAVYLFGGYALAHHFSTAQANYVDQIPTNLLGWFVVYQILACLLFGSLFIAIGAACTDIKESQNLVTPLMLLLVFPMMVWFIILRDPMSSFSTWLSYFPPATPMLMMLRMSASSAIPLWQPLLGVGVVLLSTLVCVFTAGRVFRIGILAQGKAPKLTELMRWVISG